MALVAAATLAWPLAPSAASPDGSHGAQAAKAFHKCRAAQAKLKRNGILQLRRKGANCRLARRVAYGVLHGASDPRGFACEIGEGGNQFPVRCSRGRQQVRFTLEG